MSSLQAIRWPTAQRRWHTEYPLGRGLEPKSRWVPGIVCLLCAFNGTAGGDTACDPDRPRLHGEQVQQDRCSAIEPGCC